MPKILSLPGVISGLLLDYDFTMYSKEAGALYLASGEAGEIKALAQQLGVDFQSALNTFSEMKLSLNARHQHLISRWETMLALDQTVDWFTDVRNACYEPEKYLHPVDGLAEAITSVLLQYKVAVVSNSPTQLIVRGFQALGFTHDLIVQLLIVGPERGRPKPDPESYRLAAELLGIPHNQCLSIGDSEAKDGFPALGLGMGAIIIEDVYDLMGVLSGLLPA